MRAVRLAILLAVCLTGRIVEARKKKGAKPAEEPPSPPIGIEKLPDELREKVPQLREKAPGEADAPAPLEFDPAWLEPGVNVTAFGKLKTLKLMLANLPPGGALLAGILATFKPEGHFSTLAAVSSRLEVPVVATLSLPAAREHIAEGSSGTPAVLLFVRDHVSFGGGALLGDAAAAAAAAAGWTEPPPGQNVMGPGDNVDREPFGTPWLQRKRYEGRPRRERRRRG